MFLLLVPIMLGFSSAANLQTDIQMDELVYMPGELVNVLVKIDHMLEDKTYFFDYWVDEHYLLNSRVLSLGNNEIQLFFEAPQTPGFHKIRIKIYDNKGYSTTREKEFAVSPETKGFIVDLQPKVSITNMETTLTLKIANLGTYDDLFEILLPGYYTKSNHSYVEVASHDMEYVDIEADFSEFRSSNYNFPVKVCSLYLWSCLTNNAEVLVKRDEAKETLVSLSGEDFYIYPNERVMLNVYLNNTSLFNKSYSLELTPIDFFGDLSESKFLSLKGGETGRIRTTLFPNETGKFSVKYTILSNGVEIKTGIMNVTALENPIGLTAAAIFSPSYGWLYALISFAIILGLSYIFIRNREGGFNYPYFK